MQLVVDRVYDPTDFRVFIHTMRTDIISVRTGDYVRIASPSGQYVIARVQTETLNFPVSVIRLNRPLGVNLGVFLGQIVTISVVPKPDPATKVVLAPIEDTLVGISLDNSRDFNDLLFDSSGERKIQLRNVVVHKDFILPVYMLNRVIEFKILDCTPSDCRIDEVWNETTLILKEPISRDKGQKYERVCYDDIGGMRDQISYLRYLIEGNLAFPQIALMFGVPFSKGILIIGKSGCGKTMIGTAIQNEMPSAHIVKASRVLCQTSQKAAAMLNDIWRKVEGPAIVFIDDLDEILQQSATDHRLFWTALNLIDRLMEKERVVVIATTKEVESIPSRFRSVNRLSKSIEIPEMSEEKRADILRKMTRSMCVNDSLIIDYAKKCENKTGAELRLEVETDLLEILPRLLAAHPQRVQKLSVREIRQIVIRKSAVSKDTFPDSRAKSQQTFAPEARNRSNPKSKRVAKTIPLS